MLKSFCDIGLLMSLAHILSPCITIPAGSQHNLAG